MKRISAAFTGGNSHAAALVAAFVGLGAARLFGGAVAILPAAGGAVGSRPVMVNIICRLLLYRLCRSP
jgi:hypothetical protein